MDMRYFSFMRPLAGALARVSPQDCQLCGLGSPSLLCADCAADLPFRVEQGCPCCGESGAADQRCGACVGDPPHFDNTVSAFRYEFPLDRLLQAYKFRAHLALTDLLVDALAAQLERQLAVGRIARPDIIVPLPLAAPRLAERGFNQSALLGHVLAERFNIRFAAAGLIRIRDTPPQTGLKRAERQKNVKNAFACGAGLPDISGLCVALVDDVMTTGATMSAAAQALKKAGARTVDAWAVARALQH